MLIMQQKEKKKADQTTQVNDKKVAIQYQLFRWGPCLVKLSISKENQEL